MFLSLVAIIFSIFIGYNIYSVENSQQTFDVSFLNIEALASGEKVFILLWIYFEASIFTYRCYSFGFC